MSPCQRFAATLLLPTLLAVPAAAQVSAASGFVTISIAGLGNTTTVAGDSRIPVLPRDVSLDAASHTVHLRATGHRGVVRELEIEVPSAHVGQRYELGGTSGATLRVRMDQGSALTADQGHGYVSLDALDAQHVTGSYEGTFRNGTVPVVIRGRFEASFARADAGR